MKKPTAMKFTTDDLVAPYKCFAYIYNDLGFHQNETFLPGRLNSTKTQTTTPEEIVQGFHSSMTVLSSLIIVFSSMSAYGVYHTSDKTPSTIQRLFIYPAITDIVLSIVVLLSNVLLDDICTKKIILATTGVYSVLTRAQSILVVCILRLLAISTNHLTIGITKKVIFLLVQVTCSTILALLTGYANSPTRSNFKIFVFQLLLNSCIVVFLIIASIVVNLVSRYSLRQQRTQSFKVITNVSSRGNHHKVAINKLSGMSILIVLCYAVPSIYYMFVGARFAAAKQRDIKVIEIMSELHWFQIPLLVNPLLNSICYMFSHGEVAGLYFNLIYKFPN
ncbi:MAG: hypothetical protein AAFY76_15515, partial [Cyanobacteria bacterium J06649_11]